MFDEAIVKLEDRMMAEWTWYDVAYDNVSYVPIVGQPWVRFQVIWADTQMVSIGGRDRGYGYILVGLFFPSNIGARNSFGEADKVGAIFNHWSDGNLNMGVALIERVGQTEDWYQINVRVPFTYDECLRR